MEKEQCIIQMEKLNTKVIGPKMNLLKIKSNIKIYYKNRIIKFKNFK